MKSRLNATIDEDIKSKLTFLAKKNGVSLSAMISILVNIEYDKECNKNRIKIKDFLK